MKKLKIYKIIIAIAFFYNLFTMSVYSTEALFPERGGGARLYRSERVIRDERMYGDKGEEFLELFMVEYDKKERVFCHTRDCNRYAKPGVDPHFVKIGVGEQYCDQCFASKTRKAVFPGNTAVALMVEGGISRSLTLKYCDRATGTTNDNILFWANEEKSIVLMTKVEATLLALVIPETEKPKRSEADPTISELCTEVRRLRHSNESLVKEVVGLRDRNDDLVLQVKDLREELKGNCGSLHNHMKRLEETVSRMTETIQSYMGGSFHGPGYGERPSDVLSGPFTSLAMHDSIPMSHMSSVSSSMSHMSSVALPSMSHMASVPPPLLSLMDGSASGHNPGESTVRYD